MKRLALGLTLLAACGGTASVGGDYAKVLVTMPDPPTKLDVLFVVDDSESIANDQADMVAAARTELFPQLALADGTLPDLHVAVVSTSIDVPNLPDDPTETDGCTNTPNGAFLTGPWSPNPAPCAGITGSYLTDSPDGSGGRVTNFTGTLEDNFSCIATLGYQGCWVEAPLAAIQDALSGSNAANAGFLRDDAMLLVVIMSDEDDSSGTQPAMWPTDDPFDENLRDFEYGVQCTPDDASLGPRTGCVPRDGSTAIAPIDGYVAFLQSLKSDPSLVMVAGILPPTGPVNVVSQDGSDGPRFLDNACMSADGRAFIPVIRTNAVLADFPSRYVLASFCDGAMTDRLHRIASSVTGVMTNQQCIIDDTADLAPDRCNAFDVDATGHRTAIAASLVTDAATCSYSKSHLRATATVPPGHRLEVDCLE